MITCELTAGKTKGGSVVAYLFLSQITLRSDLDWSIFRLEFKESILTKLTLFAALGFCFKTSPHAKPIYMKMSLIYTIMNLWARSYKLIALIFTVDK